MGISSEPFPSPLQRTLAIWESGAQCWPILFSARNLDFYVKPSFFFFFLAVLHSLWDLSQFPEHDPGRGCESPES